MNEEAVLLVTAPAETAAGIARALVERRLAACVNQLPGVHSVYRWQGEVEEAEETLLLIKTLSSLTPEIEAALRELHPYEVFELINLPVAGGSNNYLNWIRASVR